MHDDFADHEARFLRALRRGGGALGGPLEVVFAAEVQYSDREFRTWRTCPVQTLP